MGGRVFCRFPFVTIAILEVCFTVKVYTHPSLVHNHQNHGAHGPWGTNYNRTHSHMLNVSHVTRAAFILNIITETEKHQEYLTSGIFFNLTGKSNIFFWGVCKTFSHTTRNKSIITETLKHQEYLTSGIFLNLTGKSNIFFLRGLQNI